MPTISLLYAGLFGLMNIALAFPAGRLRGSTGISVGDGGNSELTLAMRRHANFNEFVPLALIMLVLLEMNGIAATAVHGLGIALVTVRILHAVGLKADTIGGAPRAIGAGGTALLTVVMSVWAIACYL